MHGSNGEPLRAARTGAGLRGRWPRTVVLTAAAALAAIGVAGCQGHSSSSAAAGSVAQAAASGGAALSPAPSGAALAPLAWSAARAPLPADADGVSSQYVMLGDVSCPAAGYCVAVGIDRASTDSGDVYQGLAETLAGGTWTPAAVPDVSSPDALSFGEVSCPARGRCVAVGFVWPSTRVGIPLIEQLSGGRWHPVTPPRPGDASSSAGLVFTGISCPVADWCVATGWYINTSGHRAVYVDTLSGGTWTASAAPLPPARRPTRNGARTRPRPLAGSGAHRPAPVSRPPAT